MKWLLAVSAFPIFAFLTLTAPAFAQSSPAFASDAASCAQSAAYLSRVSGFTTASRDQYANALCWLGRRHAYTVLDAVWWFKAPNQAAANLNLISSSFPIAVNGAMTWGPY